MRGTGTGRVVARDKTNEAMYMKLMTISAYLLLSSPMGNTGCVWGKGREGRGKDERAGGGGGERDVI